MAIFKAFWKFLVHIYRRIYETRVVEAAAAIAYYAIFSFFPLILFLIAFNASFLKSAEVQGQILKFAESYLPGSESLVKANINHLISSSSAVGILGTIVLLWSATLVFAGFSQNINLAWTNAKSRHFLVERLIGLMMIGILIIFLIVSIIINTLLDILPRFFPKLFELYFEKMSGAHQILIDYLPLLTIFGLFVIMYRYVPNVKVRWRESIGGALFSVLALEVTKMGFIYYLSLGTGSYRLVYGSLGAVVAFMLWIYISSFIILLGGHLCSALAYFFRPQEILESEQVVNIRPKDYTNGNGGDNDYPVASPS
ncbi:MAG: YihY/virulence factor BrkB family protein [Candidatus Rifleibacteriota bacterium]